MIDKSVSDSFKQQYLYQILRCDDLRSANGLHTYATFLNKQPQTYDLIPLYIKIFQTNNKFAVDALLKGFEPHRFFDCIRVVNPFIVREIFATFETFKRNALYFKTIRVFCGFLLRLYESVHSGYAIFPLTIAHLNSMAKYLDESKGQSDEQNREILDILLFLCDLNDQSESDSVKMVIGKQASRVRSDFFDEKRTLLDSFPGIHLEKAATVDLGIQPDTYAVD